MSREKKAIAPYFSNAEVQAINTLRGNDTATHYVYKATIAAIQKDIKKADDSVKPRKPKAPCCPKCGTKLKRLGDYELCRKCHTSHKVAALNACQAQTQSL